MNPKAIKTSVGMETPNQTAARAKALLAPTQPTTPSLTGGIPASQVDTKAPSLNIPEVTPLPDTAGEAKSFGQSYLQNLQAEAQKRLQTAEAPITEGERNIRELMGIVGNESATRTQLETQAGIPDIQEKMRQAEQSISNQIAAIDDFDDSTVFDTEKMRIDASKRDLTKGTFGAQAAEFNLQRAIQRRGQAAQLRATIAGNLALQGNFAAATEQVEKALKSIYDPIKNELQLEKFFLERNDKRYESAQKEAADLRMKEIDRQFAEIDRANVNVDAAVASGFASEQDIKTMVDMASNPIEQSAYAQKIVARASRAEVARQEAQLAASRAASAWSQRASAYELAVNGDPQAIEFLGFDPRTNNMTMEDTFNYINETMEDDRIISNLDKAVESKAAIDSMTGIIKSPFLTASARYGGPGLLAGGAAGSVVPGVGTAIGSFGGYAGGTALGYSQVANQKKDALAALSSLSNTAAFKKLTEYKSQGVTVGQLTEAERIAIGKSAADLFAALDVETDGTVTGVNVSAERYQKLVADYRAEIEAKKAQKAQIYSGLNQADAALINGL